MQNYNLYEKKKKQIKKAALLNQKQILQETNETARKHTLCIKIMLIIWK